MTADDVLARGEELRQQGVADGGGLWASAEYVDWLFVHGEALMRVARLLDEAIPSVELVNRIAREKYGPLQPDVDNLPRRMRSALDALGESKPAW